MGTAWHATYAQETWLDVAWILLPSNCPHQPDGTLLQNNQTTIHRPYLIKMIPTVVMANHSAHKS